MVRKIALYALRLVYQFTDFCKGLRKSEYKPIKGPGSPFLEGHRNSIVVDNYSAVNPILMHKLTI